MKRVQFIVGVACFAACTAVAGPISYYANLNGPSESPPNPSAGIGVAFVTIDTAAHTLDVSVTFSGLASTTTASHIHCCTASPFSGTAGVATQTPTFVSFPLGVTSGTYNHSFDLTLASSWNAAFIGAGTPATAEAALAAGLVAGEAYLNIHTTTSPGGEIRGFLVASPEPGTGLLLTLSIAGAWIIRRPGCIAPRLIADASRR